MDTSSPMSEPPSTLHSSNTTIDNFTVPVAVVLGFETRNHVLGAIGTCVNILAFLAVVKTSKVEEGRKLLLLNLIVSDGSVMITLFFYGLEESTKLSHGVGCIPTIFIVLSINMSYTTCLFIAIYNFMAMYRPFTYRKLLVSRVTGSLLVCIWIILVISSLWMVGVEPTPDKKCAQIVVMPHRGQYSLAMGSLVSTIGIVALNSAITVKLKRQIGSSSNSNSLHISRLCGGNNSSSNVICPDNVPTPGIINDISILAQRKSALRFDHRPIQKTSRSKLPNHCFDGQNQRRLVRTPHEHRTTSAITVFPPTCLRQTPVCTDDCFNNQRVWIVPRQVSEKRWSLDAHNRPNPPNQHNQQCQSRYEKIQFTRKGQHNPGHVFRVSSMGQEASPQIFGNRVKTDIADNTDRSVMLTGLYNISSDFVVKHTPGESRTSTMRGLKRDAISRSILQNDDILEVGDNIEGDEIIRVFDFDEQSDRKFEDELSDHCENDNDKTRGNMYLTDACQARSKIWFGMEDREVAMASIKGNIEDNKCPTHDDSKGLSKAISVGDWDESHPTTLRKDNVHSSAPKPSRDSVRSAGHPLRHIRTEESNDGVERSVRGWTAQKLKICRSLTIVTTYSSLLTLVFGIYMIVSASGYIGDPEAALGTTSNVVASSCPTIKSCINSIFYVWTFVRWKHYLQSMCANA